MKRIYKLLGTGVFVLLLNLQMFSQDIETLWDIDVTTASKTEEKLSDAPGIITVVSNDEIMGFGSTSLSDVLDRVTSMHMIYSGIYTWNLGSMRGQHTSVFDNHVLILINGRPLRDGISGGHNNVFYNSFPVEGIDHIEIIRGPGSVLYGTNAYSGVINIITKKAFEKTAFEASVSYGSLNTLAANVGGGVHVNDDLNINFGFRYFNDDGPEWEFFDDNVTSPKVDSSKLGKGNFSRDNLSAFIDLNYKNLRVLGGYGEMKPFGLVPPLKWQWTSPAGTKKAGDEISKMSHYFTDIGYTFEFGESYSLDANYTYNGHTWSGLVDGDLNGLQAASNNSIVEVAFNGSPVENLNFIVGGLYDYNSFNGKILEDGNISKFNAYLQVDYRFFNMLKLVAGVQMNKSEDIDANFSPRIGAILNITDNFGIKLLNSTAFRSPYPQETNVQNPLYIGNPNLKPELINTSEGQLFYQNEKIQTSLTFYYSKMTDLINKIRQDTAVGEIGGNPVYSTFFNSASHKFYGVEFEGKFALNDHFSLFVNATYQTNEDGDGIKDAAIAPNFMGKAGLLYTGNIVSAGIWNSYFGEPTQVNYILKENNKPEIASLNPEASAYNLLSLNVSFDIFAIAKMESEHKLLLTFYGDNLLNADIWYPEFARYQVNSLPLHAGTTLNGKITYKF
jgi:outer membrane receptor for ferrienterochelin and colicin